MKKLYISDPHFGHFNVIRHDNRPFSSADEMDEFQIAEWNKRAEPDDEVYIAGDFSWYGLEKTNEILSRLNGKKILIKGNHDRFNKQNTPNFDKILGEKTTIRDGGYKVIINHTPELFYVGDTRDDVIMLYGHIHNSVEDILCEKAKEFILAEAKKLGYPMKMKAYNIGCMHHGYGPVTLEEIFAKYEKK